MKKPVLGYPAGGIGECVGGGIKVCGGPEVTGAFDRLYERQTGLTGTSRSVGLQQAAQLKELDDLVRNNKIAERLAQLKAGRAGKP